MAPSDSDITTQALTSRSSENDADDELAKDPTPTPGPDTRYDAWKRKPRSQKARTSNSSSKHGTRWQCPDPYCHDMYSDQEKSLPGIMPPPSTPTSSCYQVLYSQFNVLSAKKKLQRKRETYAKIMMGHQSRAHRDKDEVRGRWKAGKGKEEQKDLFAQAGRSSGVGDHEGQGRKSEQRDYVEG